MTLPTSGSISTDQILAELRVANANRNYPLSLNDADVLALAGKSAPPVTMPDDFYGKSAAPPAQPMTLYPSASNLNYGNVPSQMTGAINISVAVTGGARPLTYSWGEIAVTNGMVLKSETNGPSLNFERTLPANSNGTATARARCTVTDANGVTASTALLTGSITWGNA